MKKTLFILATTAVMTMQAVALAAADYVPDDNKVSINDADINNYQTVLIVNSENKNDIVYVDQVSDVFTASVNFMLKPGTAEGTYKILLGNIDGGKTEMNFVVGGTTPPPAETVEMRHLEGDETSSIDGKNMAFVAESINLADYNAIQITVKDPQTGTDMIGGYLLSEILDGYFDGTVNFGLQINNVPDEFADGIKVSLVKDAVKDGTPDWVKEGNE